MGEVDMSGILRRQTHFIAKAQAIAILQRCSSEVFDQGRSLAHSGQSDTTALMSTWVTLRHAIGHVQRVRHE